MSSLGVQAGRGDGLSAQLFAVGDGLSEAESRRRLAEDGPNELPSPESRRLMQIALAVLREPMVYLLLACGAVYFVIGSPGESLMLLGFLVLIILITVVQEGKAEHTLEALRSQSSPIALAIRDGRLVRVESRRLVRGDLVVLNEGDRVPADGRLVFVADLAVDESLLTGESVSVAKNEIEDAVYAGTMAVRGRGVMRIERTGPRTKMGRIGLSLKSAARESTGLERETRAIVKATALVGFSFCVIVVLVSGLIRGQWLNGILSGLTLAMAVLPNEIPAVLIIYLSLGAWRVAKARVLARKASALEALGATTVLCVDKTGTLTMNRMSVQRLVVGSEELDLSRSERAGLPEKFHPLLEFAVLASEGESRDPMENAFLSAGGTHLAGTEHLHPDWSLYRSYPLTTQILAVSRAWAAPGAGEVQVAAKGAPESIIELCHLSDREAESIMERVERMAEEGLRVLGVASARASKDKVSANPHDFDFGFVGLVGLGDPVRAGVPESVRELRGAGVRVCMLTGDHPMTAMAVAEHIGLETSGRALTGAELERMSDSELAVLIEKTNVFCRVQPQHKLRLVNALKARGHVVAMTGDGVNDAPALRSAHIGIAMGARGTDVAREASSLVLLEDDFTSITDAIRMGRRIYRNLRQSISYLLSVHIPIAGLSVLPVVFDLPLILLPVHVAFIHLVIEPACSTVFEAIGGEEELMRDPPRDPSQKLIGRDSLTRIAVQGGGLLVLLFGIFLIALLRGQGTEDARALSFTSLVFGSVGLIFAYSRGVYGTMASAIKRNRALRWIVLSVFPMLASVLYLPFLRRAFGFSILHPLDLLLCFSTGLVAAGVFAGIGTWIRNVHFRVERKPSRGGLYG